MYIFLFLKQIVDMLYDYIWLDVILAASAIVLIIYQLWMLRHDGNKVENRDLSKATDACENALPKRRMLRIPDICLLGIFIIYSTHMFFTGKSGRYLGFTEDELFGYGKVASAFLLYVIGRIGSKRVAESTGALVGSGYIVVYANLVIRIIRFGINGNMDLFLHTSNTHGLIYYFDTDLAYAMLLALIFIAMYASNNILKFVTIFITCPFMILHSDADVQKYLMIVVYVILLLFMSERAFRKRKFSDFILPVFILGLLALIAVLVIPIFTGQSYSRFTSLLSGVIDTYNFDGRYSSWIELWQSSAGMNVVSVLFGINNSYGVGVGNQYLSIILSLGLVGLVLALGFIISVAIDAVSIEDRKTYYVTVMLAILFLGTCIVVNGMNYTQISWFPMLYAGMAACKAKKP